MTTSLSKILDQIWVSHLDRNAAAEAAAKDLPPHALAELLSIVATAHAGAWLKAESAGENVLLTVGEFRTQAVVTSGADGRSLIESPDIAKRLATDSDVIAAAWGPPLVAPAANLLYALQYARDNADSLVYRAADRGVEVAKVSQWLRIEADLLRALVMCVPRMLSELTD